MRVFFFAHLFIAAHVLIAGEAASMATELGGEPNASGCVKAALRLIGEAGHVRREPLIDPLGPTVVTDSHHEGAAVVTHAKSGAIVVAEHTVEIVPTGGGAARSLHCPRVEYEGIAHEQTAKEAAEQALGVPLGPEYARGGFRRIFVDPRDPQTLLKVYDPTLQKGLTPQKIAKMIQRELAFEQFLRDAGLPVAEIDRSPAARELWKKGIIRMKKIEGTSLWHHLPDVYHTGDFPKIDELFAKITTWDSPLRAFAESHWGIKLHTVSEGFNAEHVGIDMGSSYSNILLGADGSPIMIDW